VYIYEYMCVYLSIYSFTHTNAYTYIHTYTCTDDEQCANRYMHACVYIYLCICMNIHIHMNIYTYTYAFTYTYTYTYTCTCTGDDQCGNGCDGVDAIATHWCSTCNAAICRFCQKRGLSCQKRGLSCQGLCRWNIELFSCYVASYTLQSNVMSFLSNVMCALHPPV